MHGIDYLNKVVAYVKDNPTVAMVVVAVLLTIIVVKLL